MPTVQANVPLAHLATAMGAPNHLLVEYSTDVLLPVPGPYLIAQLRREFLYALMLVNDFLAFAEDALRFLSAGGVLEFPSAPAQQTIPRFRDSSAYGREMTFAAQQALDSELSTKGRSRREARVAKGVGVSTKELLLGRLACPNLVFREMFQQGLLLRPPRFLSDEFMRAKTFDARCALVLAALLRSRQKFAPQKVTATMTTLSAQAMATAGIKQRGYLRTEFDTLGRSTQNLLTQWMVAYHLSKTPPIAKEFAADLTPELGFAPALFVKEWALNRKERMRLAFGTPDLRGPLAAEPVPPSGTYRREDYYASQNELALLTAESRQTRSTESLGLSSGSLRRELNGVYYSGPGTLNQLTSQASASLLAEERRSVVLSMIREVSETRENASLDVTTQVTSSTISRKAAGVDPKLAATHHRFKVVVPVDATAEMYDAGLTWCPRVFNPFFALRQAIADAYETAYRSHLEQYYIPEPVSPPLVWETYTVATDVNMVAEDLAVMTQAFSIQLPSTDRADHPDFGSATVQWNQSEDFWNDDPDHFTARLQNLAFSAGTIQGTVRLETDDEGSDFQGFAHIEVPVLRYSQDTVNAQVEYLLAMQDYSLKRQALEAQARQFARIKEREFIENHERREPLLKVVFYELVRRLCVPSLTQHISYYKEILSRCIDWRNAKLDAEPAPLNALTFPDFEADHFVNSFWVRMFLPVSPGAEGTLFDALNACGSLQVRASVTNALNQVNAVRTRLQQSGPAQIDQFATELVIGEHIEGVMSAHELSS